MTALMPCGRPSRADTQPRRCLDCGRAIHRNGESGRLPHRCAGCRRRYKIATTAEWNRAEYERRHGRIFNTNMVTLGVNAERHTHTVTQAELEGLRRRCGECSAIGTGTHCPNGHEFYRLKESAR